MNKEHKRIKTETRSFGSSERVGHDSSKFYNSKLYKEQKINKDIQYIENCVKEKDIIYQKSSENMDELEDNSIHLMVTSPPYNVSKEYDDDLSLNEYCGLLYSVFSETYKKLVPGGRACINIANIGRKPYIPLHSFVIDIMVDIGFLMRGEIIWNKASSAGTSCAWGSWLSASNPVLRDVHEYILVFSKGSFSRKKTEDKEDTINKDEFLEYTKSIWTFQTISARQIGHPAPFPVELPYRLIQLYTFKKDVVLDPFLGSGTTCIAAKEADRYYIGYEVEGEYVKLARERIKAYTKQMMDVEKIIR